MDQSCHHQLIDNEEVIENLGEKKHCNTEYNTNSSIEANVSTYTTPSTQEYIEYTNQNFAYPVNTQGNGLRPTPVHQSGDFERNEDEAVGLQDVNELSS